MTLRVLGLSPGWLAVLLIGAGGCIGQIGDGGEDDGRRRTVSGSLVCDTGLEPSATPLIRLSILQYENTLRDLFSSEVLAAPTVSAALAQFPADGEAEASFSQMDGRLSQRHVDSYYGVSDSVATLITSDPARLSALAGACANETPLAETCASDFVASFGRRAFRRPLSEQEHARYLELYDPDKSSAEVFRSMLFTVLMSAPFNYHLEIEGKPVDGEDRLALTGYELASRLSYHFWQSMPDAALLDAAASGTLDTDEGFRAEVERLFGDDRTRQTVRRFYAEWYRLDIFGGFAQTPAFAAFADGVEATDALYQAMVAEIEALIDRYTWESEGSYADLLSSELALTQSPELASLYGVAPWDGTSEPARFSPEERSGLLTRAAFLITSNERTNPFKRGSYIKKAIVCDPLTQPDPNDLPAGALNEPEVDPEKSTRERFAAKTAPAECQACHAQFNPIGFALEGYDALGRWRTEEKIYSEDGELLATVAVDTAVELSLDGRTSVAIESPVGLSQAIVDSGKAETCFARHYFRYTYRRGEDDSADGCAMVAVREALLNGGGLRAALKAIALEPAFRTRIVTREP
jgi:hypothetical protein